VGLEADLHLALDDMMWPNNKDMEPADISTASFKISPQVIK